LEGGYSAAQLVSTKLTRHTADTFTCLHCRQVKSMRFSSIFQRQPRPREARKEETSARQNPRPTTSAPPRELPEDLDARVRLLGEWQVSEN
jgi:hypothetical protein